ncbi:hypothetical protein L1987_80802 [Smallanthus sonchifolius]|uniref:Uncharacterized protein n=1 Tax=Smallanthus sonchifolius TaxID=185202 RepID=A0ACB8YNR7_9ASTR|nr:hypothetical protein L1987_80802 [Smallanthus sonchifolius]
MYKYEESGETDDMLEFDASVDVTLDSTLVDVDDDFLCTCPDGEGILVVFGDMDSNHDEDSNLQKPASDHDEETKSQRGPTIKPKANKGKTMITYNKRGVPIGDGAKKLATFEGMTARTMSHFVLDPKSRKHSLQSIGTKWRNFKHILYKKFIKPHKKDPGALLNPPAIYPFVKKEQWKLFVAHRLSKKWEDTSKKSKNVRANNKYNHRLSRKGYAGLTADMMQETDKTEEEIDRATLWKKARELKTGGFDSNVQEIVDKIDELQNSGCFESCGTHDVLTEALGTEEQRGHVRGLGKYVKPHQYFYEPKTVKQYLDTEKKKVDERFNKLEEEVEKLKRGVTNVSEAASCQMGGCEDDLEDKPHEESLDNSCYLAVDVASNIVAKGAIMKYSDSGEIIEVMMEIRVQGEAFLPIPLEEELIMKVKDAVGHILSWPRHLVIRCSDLEKAVAKPKSKKRLREHDEENGKEKKQPVEPDEVVEKENAKENGKENANKDDAIVENKKESGKEKENEKKDDERVENKTERGKEKENEKELMTAMMVDGQVSKVDSIKVQCEDGLYGYESYTYLTWDDFKAVFTLEELTGAVITSYTMYLFEQIKNGSKRDHGICFVSPTASSPRERKTKSKNIDDSSRSIAERLSKRKDNDIILIPYNPG